MLLSWGDSRHVFSEGLEECQGFFLGRLLSQAGDLVHQSSIEDIALQCFLGSQDQTPHRFIPWSSLVVPLMAKAALSKKYMDFKEACLWSSSSVEEVHLDSKNELLCPDLASALLYCCVLAKLRVCGRINLAWNGTHLFLFQSRRTLGTTRA